MITWQNFNPRAEISAQVAGTGLKFQPRGCTQPWAENSSCNCSHYPTRIYSKGRAEISTQSTGLSSVLGLKMLHVIKPLDDISYLQELEDKHGLKLVRGLRKTII